MHDLDDDWFKSPACHRHPQAPSERPCERCGTFCCTGCLDPRDRAQCEPCAAVSTHADRTREAMNVAWKLALAPGLILLASFSRLAHQRELPPVFALWLAPLLLAFAVAKTERAGFAWLGTLASIGLLTWFALGVTYAGTYDRFIDLLLLSIAPLVALPGCVRLSRVSARLRLLSACAPQGA